MSKKFELIGSDIAAILMDPTKKLDRLVKWDSFMLNIALATAQMSKDPKKKVGAVISTPDFRQISIGFNGFPKGFPETEESWEAPNKYDYVVHAEQNAIINAPFDTNDCIMYTTLQPCSACAGAIINAGVSTVVYLIDSVLKDVHKPDISSKKLAYLTTRKYKTVE